MTPRKLKFLKAVADYFPSLRAQVQDVCGETNDRVSRQILLELHQERFIGKTRMEVVSSMGAAAPAYFLLPRGAEYLAAEVDEAYLHMARPTPNWQFLLHWIKCTEFKIVFDKAIAAQEGVSIGKWLGEWDVANPDEKVAEKRYMLFTLLREKPRLVCNPDIGFLLCVRSYAKTYYVEVDRETSGIQQIANSKTPGYAELLKQRGHKKRFETNMDTFSVLSISPTPGRRDLLRKAIKGKDGAELWKFASWTDMTPEYALNGAIWHPTEGEAAPLVKTPPARKLSDSVGAGAGSALVSVGGPP